MSRGDTNWQRLSAGDGAKGPRMYDWALLELAESAAEEWPRQLLLRRSLEDESEIVAYRTFAPANTPLALFAQVAGTRWAIEDSLESAKGEVGLDQYEVRRWVSWYRHITLALLAHAYLTVTRAQAAESGQKKDRAAIHHWQGSHAANSDKAVTSEGGIYKIATEQPLRNRAVDLPDIMLVTAKFTKETVRERLSNKPLRR